MPVDDAFIHTNSPLPGNNGAAHKDGVYAETIKCQSREIIVRYVMLLLDIVVTEHNKGRK